MDEKLINYMGWVISFDRDYSKDCLLVKATNGNKYIYRMVDGFIMKVELEFLIDSIKWDIRENTEELTLLMYEKGEQDG